MKYREVLEGETKLIVPEKGGITKDEEVFYNPHMRLNRDITVLLVKHYEPRDYLDVMTASGARGIRVAKEAGVHATLNDLNPKALQAARKNAEINDVKVSTTAEDARVILTKSRFDFVDLDPFGPPVEYVDAATSCVRNNGVLGVCATDTSALSGSYPTACLRKYDAHPLRCDCYNEIGLRILLGFIARTFTRHDMGATPVYSHSTRHYMRCQMQVNRKTKKTLKSMGWLQYCVKCMWRDYRRLDELAQTCGCGAKLKTAGPLWQGEYADRTVCESIMEKAEDEELRKFIGSVCSEQDITKPYYDLHKICRLAKTSSPKMEELKEKIESEGYLFRRTHFNPTGIRTDMEAKELVDAVKGLSAKRK
ncbi:MAG: tRNA (guanine(10)-N(2))-dimethyltransferase [Candidatus Altiarchaeota archaeon]|nr:tRNA (guanine(10)-N(2))-dimethyltransferase [Candidatus Altiarchaeota archaeon]